MHILIDMPVYEPALKTLKELADSYSSQDIQIDLISEPVSTPRELPEELLKKCNVLFCSTPPTNHDLLQQLQLIQISSAGYTQLFNHGFEYRDIHACNALGVFDIPIAEWNIAMMINLARNFRQMIRNQENAVWDRSAIFQNEIRGGIVGIWGYGGIGRETARMAKTLGMQVHVLSRSAPKPRDLVYALKGTGDPTGTLPDKLFNLNQKEEFLSGLDYLILAVPLTHATEGMVGVTELSFLKKSAFILNPARGPLIQEQALIDALQQGNIAGAALDTHYYYPMPADHPFWKMQNVIMTPHISGSSASPHFLQRVWDIFVENVKRKLSGDQLLNELSKEALKGN